MDMISNFQRTSDLNKLVVSSLIGLGLTALSYFVGVYFNWFNQPINYVEVAAVLTSYACTFLCTAQSRMNYPIGMLSTALLAYVFYEQGYYGSMAQNLYLIPTLAYGFYVWGRDEVTKPVEHVKLKHIPIYLGVTAALYGVIVYTIQRLGGEVASLDGLILAGSVLAQFLLDRKKIETWFVWIAVNVLAIYVYHDTFPFITFQFVIFLLNAVWGYFEWRKTMVTQSPPLNDTTTNKEISTQPHKETLLMNSNRYGKLNYDRRKYPSTKGLSSRNSPSDSDFTTPIVLGTILGSSDSYSSSSSDYSSSSSDSSSSSGGGCD